MSALCLSKATGCRVRILASEKEGRTQMMWLCNIIKDLRDKRKEPRGIHYH